MATIQVNNTQPLRFEANGVLRFNDGVDDLIVRNKEKGTLRIRFAQREVLRWQENGTNQVPLRGDEQTPRVEIDVKLSRDDGANDIFTRIVRKAPSPETGLVFVFATVQIDVPNFAGASTGSRFSFVNAYIVPDQCEISSGMEFDTLRIVFEATGMSEPTTY